MSEREIYLNHAGTSWPKPPPVLDATRSAMSNPPSNWPDLFESAHKAVADYFSVNNPEQILLTPGCTSALNVAISDVTIPTGKRILTTTWEHHALHRPLLKHAANGIPVHYIPATQQITEQTISHSIDLNWLEKELATGDVALVAMTAACNVTGDLLPFQQVIDLAKEAGAVSLIDMAQIVGWQKLDLPALGADLVAFGGHKGLQGPWGIGGLYVADHVPMNCVSATCSLPLEKLPDKNLSDENSVPELHPRPGYCDVGSVDQWALAGLEAALEWLNQRSPEVDLANAQQQISRLANRISILNGIQLFGGGEDGMPTLAINIPQHPSSNVAKALADKGIIAGSGFQCSPSAHETLGSEETGLIRFSVGIGQADEEVEEAAKRLEATLSHFL